MRRALFQRRGDRLAGIGIGPGVARDAGETHVAGRQCAGLVEDDVRDARQRFERVGPHAENLAASQRPCGCGQRGRCSKRKCARTRHDEHGNCNRQCPRGIDHPPSDDADRRYREQAGDKHARRAIGQPRDPWPLIRRAFDQSRQRAERRRCTRRSDADSQRTSRLTDPAMTASPTALSRGQLSPVSTASSTLERPSTTTPSTGTDAPAAMRTNGAWLLGQLRHRVRKRGRRGNGTKPLCPFAGISRAIDSSASPAFSRTRSSSILATSTSATNIVTESK